MKVIMTKAEKLKKMYDSLELDSPDDRVLLSKARNGTATQEEIDELLDIVSLSSKGGGKLDEIKEFESSLIADINSDLAALEEMGSEDNDIAHKDESEQAELYADLKKRYQELVKKIEETLDAMRIAYFQIDNYHFFEDRFEKAKEELGHHD